MIIFPCEISSRFLAHGQGIVWLLDSIEFCAQISSSPKIIFYCLCTAQPFVGQSQNLFPKWNEQSLCSQFAYIR